MQRAFLLFLIAFTINLNAQLIPYRVGKLWGYSDTSGNFKIKPQFDFAEFFSGNIAFISCDSSYFGIDTLGTIITPALKYFGAFNDGLCPVQLKSGHFLYIDHNGKSVFEMEADGVENFSEGRAVVSQNKKLGIIDTKGKWIRKPDFDTSSRYFKSGFLMGISKGKYFYINRDGKNLKLEDSISPAGIFNEGLAAVWVNKRSAGQSPGNLNTYLEYIDSSGKIVLSKFYNDSIDYSGYLAPDREFIDGRAVVKSRNDIGWDYFIIDRKGRLSPLYSYAKHLGDTFFLGVLGYYMSDVRILDSNYYVAGQFQHKPTQVGEFGNGLLAYRDVDGNWGYMNSNCRIIIPALYTAAYKFINGYAYIVKNGQQGVIDTKGKHFFK